MKSSRRNLTWAIATTLKCTVKQTVAFVNYYLNLGANHIFLFFDDPEDPAVEIVEKNSKVTATRCTPEYFRKYINGYFEQFDYQYVIYRQGLNATNALNWAREMDISWIAHVDVDELIYPGTRDIKLMLRRSPVEILRMTILEAVPEELEYENFFHEIRFYKSPAAFHKSGLRYPVNSILLRLAVLLGVKSPFTLNDRYFRAHYKSKCFVRTDLDIINMRIHTPAVRKKHLIEFRSRRIFLLHFDSCGFQLWFDRYKFKIANGDRPGAKKNLQKITKYIMELMEREASEEEFKEAYKKTHYINEKDIRILRMLGLIRKIQLPSSQFEIPLK